MKQKIMLGILINAVLALLSGCGNGLNPQINSLNNNLEKKRSPGRFYKTKETDLADTYTSEWTGEKSSSMAFTSAELTNDVYKLINTHCGFTKEDLIETRKVSYQHPKYYEVWVFKDSKSERQDKTSALSVILTQFPNGGGVDIELVGQCHSKPVAFTFGK